MVFAGIGGGILGYDKGQSHPLLLTSLGLMTTSFYFSYNANKNMKEAIKIYNNGLSVTEEPKTQIKFGLMPNGFALGISF